MFLVKLTIIVSSFNLQLFTTVGVFAGSAGALLFALDQSVKASGTELHPPKNPWSHSGLLQSFDHSRLIFLFVFAIGYKKTISIIIL